MRAMPSLETVSPGDYLNMLDRQVFLEALFPEARLVYSPTEIRVAGLGLGGLEVHRYEPVWRNYGSNQGGGLLQLVSWALSGGHCNNYKAAIDWIKSTFGSGVKSPPVKRNPHPSAIKKEHELNPKRFQVIDTSDAPKTLSLSELGFIKNPITDCWCFKRYNGAIAGYVIRCETSTGKSILPIAWARVYDSLTDKMYEQWWITRFKSPPLYNADLIKKYPKSLIVLVEGEKTAETATYHDMLGAYKDDIYQHYSDASLDTTSPIIFTSLFAGISSLDQTPFEDLRGRLVIGIPDADPVGKSGRRIGIENMLKIGRKLLDLGVDYRLAGINGFSWKNDKLGRAFLSVDTTSQYFDCFPEKWDLADPYPEGKNSADIVRMIKEAVSLGKEPFIGANWNNWMSRQ